jgi:tRNA (guanine37-N1)-methyltransferase
MRIDIVTLFPQMFDSVLSASLLGRGIESGKLEVNLHDLREHGLGKHRSVDDEPYGGGAGMVMRPEPIFDAVEELRADNSHIVLLSPRGSLLRHELVAGLAEQEHLILICGRYEGVDERVAEFLANEELSIGDFVLAGGELAAMVVVEALSRFVPGVIGNRESLTSESHAQGLLEYPQYTRPATFRGHAVPEVLVSGHHAEVERWRRAQSESLTRERRPDLT